jgi:hypothetical protein
MMGPTESALGGHHDSAAGPNNIISIDISGNSLDVNTGISGGVAFAENQLVTCVWMACTTFILNTSSIFLSGLRREVLKACLLLVSRA